ncbi:MAG: pyridoxamine 5'-phosphate oxidase family protein [Rhodocyclaceae bacterium]|nr:pyridoxamine 5'-phosphate oxidase family protein [Rhodocyclaceae bacterium]MDZ4213619.1 pyridoxamine 5'-phosphate oxidase family protein [Rhodocyclaceae bacterium]
MSTEHRASTNANNEPIPGSLPEADQARLRHLLETQKYAVLATDNHGQPYTSLMAYSITDDLRAFILMTERGRLKYENLMSNPRVAIMIDNRENLGSDLNATLAVTSLGVAEEISSEGGDAARAFCLARHPALQSFAESPNCAFIRIQVTSYVIVQQFQDVIEWRLSAPAA